MADGVVKTIAIDKATGKRKGFGFIMPAGGGKEVFFHRTAVQADAFDQINEGDAVTYAPGMGDKGPRAEDVRLR